MSATTKVVTGKVRFSYANVWEPRAMEGSDRAKYSVSILIPKTDSATLARVKEAIDTALKEGIAKLGGKIPPTWKNPLRDGDTERPDNPEYAGTCSSMPTRTTVLASWTSTSTPSSKKRISTQDAMAGRRSTSTFSTRMATKALLAG